MSCVSSCKSGVLSAAIFFCPNITHRNLLWSGCAGAGDPQVLTVGNTFIGLRPPGAATRRSRRLPAPAARLLFRRPRFAEDEAFRLPTAPLKTVSFTSLSASKISSLSWFPGDSVMMYLAWAPPPVLLQWVGGLSPRIPGHSPALSPHRSLCASPSLLLGARANVGQRPARRVCVSHLAFPMWFVVWDVVDHLLRLSPRLI